MLNVVFELWEHGNAAHDILHFSRDAY